MNFKPRNLLKVLIVVLIATIIVTSGLGVMSKLFLADNYSLLTAKLYCDIYLYLEIPTMLSVVLVGAGLGVSGCVMQTILQNSLADPSILGVSTSSSFFALIGLLFIGSVGVLPINLVMFLGSLIGAIIVLVILFIFSMIIQNGRLVGVLLAGVALSAMFGALMTMMLSYMSVVSLKSSIAWMYGSIDSINWLGFIYIAVSLFFGLLFIFPLSKRLDVLAIGYDNALALGINLKKVLIIAVIGVAIILAGGVAVVGPIGFVGLISPHIARRLSSSKQGYLMVNSSLVAANIMLFAELVSKNIAKPYIIPLSAITALMGAPFFLWLLWKNYRSKEL
ncbi:iron ABC transporter permease [Francisellaceae bacterium]|nr:iron ABC transporter permease [Francisellaceae bacterium]